MNWEYRADKITNWGTVVQDLNSLGDQGWELVNIFKKDDDYYALFKRLR